MTSGDPIFCPKCGEHSAFCKCSEQLFITTCMMCGYHYNIQIPHICPKCGIEWNCTFQWPPEEKKFEVRPCTVDMICNCNDHILLIKRDHEPFKDKWALPGGYVDKEDTLKAAIRELEEETGLKLEEFEEPSLLGIFSEYDRDPRHTISIVYHVRLIMGSDLFPEVKGSSDAKQAKWFKLEELPEFAFDHKDMIDMYLKIEYGNKRRSK